MYCYRSGRSSAICRPQEKEPDEKKEEEDKEEEEEEKKEQTHEVRFSAIEQV